MLGLSLSEEKTCWRNMVGAVYVYFSNQEKGLDYVDNGNSNITIPLWMYYSKW